MAHGNYQSTQRRERRDKGWRETGEERFSPALAVGEVRVKKADGEAAVGWCGGLYDGDNQCVIMPRTPLINLTFTL